MQDNYTEWDVALLISLVQNFGLGISFVYIHISIAMLSCFVRCYLPTKCLNAHSSRLLGVASMQQSKLQPSSWIKSKEKTSTCSECGTSGDGRSEAFFFHNFKY